MSNEQLKDSLQKLKNPSSKNSSVPSSSDQNNKPSDKSKPQKGFKRGSKYDHVEKTGNKDAIASLFERVVTLSNWLTFLTVRHLLKELKDEQTIFWATR